MSLRKKEEIAGYIFISPWILGFLLFTAFPVINSFYISLTDYNMLQTPKFVGLFNYKTIFTRDPEFLQSVYNTLYYVAFRVPLSIVVALAIAMLLNQRVRGMRLYRTFFYLPNVVSMVAVAVLWMWVFDPTYGLLNQALSHFGLKGPRWLGDPAWSKPALILMSLWHVGGSVIIFLSALQGVPQNLYEVAKIDGARPFKMFTKITLPMISPTIFFNLIIGLIGGFQVFGEALIMTDGGPLRSTYFYALHLYKKAFSEWKMGYASAMAWILLVAVLILTLIIIKTSDKWVYYEGASIMEKRRKKLRSEDKEAK